MQEKANIINVQIKGNSQSLFYIFLDSVLPIFSIEQHYILGIAHLGITWEKCFEDSDIHYLVKK